MDTEERSKGNDDCTNCVKVDCFKTAFKFYRSLKNCESSNNVFYSDQADDYEDKINSSCFHRFVYSPSSQLCPLSSSRITTIDEVNKGHECVPIFGLKSPHTWNIFRLNFPEGLIFIENPFTPEGQRYWISRCTLDYPSKPHITNIENLQIRSIQNTRVRVKEGGRDTTSNQDEEPSSDFYKKLRWVTFGYHHDWDTKVYSEAFKCPFPMDLAELTKYVSLVLGFDEFKAEAAIVNYYHLDSTLSGHQDRSERHQEAPLFSISFGQNAVFLIGGDKKEIEPIPICLKSGDIVVMSGKSRLSYHGVPRIMQNNSSYWLIDSEASAGTEVTEEPANKKARHEEVPQEASSSEARSCVVCACAESSRTKEEFLNVVGKWDDFLTKYISECRINLNVRQVLLPGELKLPSSDL